MRRPLAFWRQRFQNRPRTTRIWQPQIVDEVCVNGCIPIEHWDEWEQEINELICDEAAEFNFETLWEHGEMPVLRYDENFVQWRNNEIKTMDELTGEGFCFLPWVVLESLAPIPSSLAPLLYYSQGNRPSCMGHADAFAGHSSTLIQMARGAPLDYKPINAIYTWALSKNGSLSGGQTVSAMAAAANKLGHYPIELVGSDNLNFKQPNATQVEQAKQWQWAIMFLNYSGDAMVNEIFDSCHAGMSIAVGNSHAVSGAETDRNGVKVAKVSGSWAHATSFTGYRKVNGTEYIFWVNSHGPRYGVSDEGEPADGCWMDKTRLAVFAKSMPSYGAPYIVFPESTWQRNTSIKPAARIPFPKNFRF